MVEATPHSRTQQPMRVPKSVQSGFDAGQPLWTITVWPVTPHSESSVPMVNGMAPTFKPGFTLYGEAWRGREGEGEDELLHGWSAGGRR